jgi:hypothetical protein
MKLLNGSLNSTPLLVLIIVNFLKLSSPHNKNSIKKSLSFLSMSGINLFNSESASLTLLRIDS